MKKVPVIPRTLMLLCAILFALPFQASAQEAINFKDTKTPLKAIGGMVRIVGPHMVYLDSVKEQSQVFYRNMTTGEIKQITDTPNSKDSTSIGLSPDGQVLIAWAEMKDSADTNYNYDVYTYNLTTGGKKKHNGTDAHYTKVQVEGNYLVYFNNTAGSFYICDLRDNKETLIQDGWFPILSDGKIIYSTRKDTVNRYDPQNGSTDQIFVPAPNEFLDSTDVSNGKFYLWVVDGPDNSHQYRLLNLDTKQVYNLTDWRTDIVTSIMSIGERYAAFITGDKEHRQLYWVDLLKGTAESMSNPAASYKYFHFQGDQLVMNMSKPNENYFYRTMNGTEDRFASLLPKPAPVFKPIIVEKTVGAKGGTLTADGGKTVLAIGKGGFSKNAKVKLTSTPIKGSETVMLSTAWVVSSDQKWSKNAALTVTYDSDLNAGKTPVLAVYDVKTAVWKAIACKVDSGRKTAAASISSTGVYAVISK